MATISFLGAAVCANAQNLNGTLDKAFYATPLYVQTINTGFGLSAGGGDASGSELDAVYAKVSGGNLYLFVAGCIQANGNHLNVFIAGGDTTGQTVLAVPTTATMKAMNGSIFPANFTNTFALDINDSGSTLYTEEYTLTGTPAGGYVGALPGSGGIFAGSSGGISSLYLNNTLTSTMGAQNEALSGSNVGASVTTGLEIVIPTSAIGYTGGSVNVLIDINGSGDGYLSNQFLPGLAVGSGNLGTTTFNLGPIPPQTNYVTFQLDMSEQVAFGNFTNNFVDPSDPNNTNSIAASGDFAGWGTGYQLTNNPSLPDLRSNLYTGTFPVVGFLPTSIQLKYRVNNLDGGYESPISTSGGNRTISITNANQVLPVIFYDDQKLGDLLYSNCAVTFSIYVTNGQTIYNGGSYNSGSDQIYVNGNWLGWGWALGGGSGVQMIASDNPNVYTNTLILPKGNSIYLTYKYSFDGLDNENGTGTNHLREIRSYGSSYALPQDVWSYSVLYPGSGNSYPNPGLSTTNIVEPDFGYLQIGAPSNGSYPITWLGRPAVHLEGKSSLSAGIWNDYTGTDAMQSTNWPANAGGSAQFFRLIKY